MGRHAQFVMGPAGSGKSTYCLALSNHIRQSKRSCLMINLDPAAEQTYYEPHIDIRDLITIDDVMDELKLGPNGGLIYALNFLLEEFDWLEDEVGKDVADEYIIIDLPGQMEIFAYSSIVQRLVNLFQTRLNVQCCAVYLLESSFISQPQKFFSGALAALSCMIQLEIPHVNVLSKLDLIEGRPGEMIKVSPFIDTTNFVQNEEGVQQSKSNQDLEEQPYDIDPSAPKSGYASTFDDTERDFVDKRRKNAQLDRFLEADTSLLIEQLNSNMDQKYIKLSKSLLDIFDEFGLVNFVPLNIHDEDSIEALLYQVDQSLQYGEDVEPREPLDYEAYGSDGEQFEDYE